MTVRRRETDSEGDYLKTRIAEALVEAMFLRGGFAVSRSGPEGGDGDEFVPDFMTTKTIVRPDSDRPLHQLIPVAVKYAQDVPAFLRERAVEFAQWAIPWPSLCLVVVSESPESGRSCFQVVELADGGETTRDLDKVPILDIYPSTVREYEQLVRKLFRLLDRRESPR
jgi:hypothetical protein